MEHPYLSAKIEEIEQTLIKPDFITIGKADTKIYHYYKFEKIKKRYLVVSVKYLNGEGFVATSFVVRKILR